MTQTATRTAAADVLRAQRALVTPHLRAAVDTLPAPIRHIAGYHFGWWDAAGAGGDDPGGKALRPTLTLLAARAAGGGTDAALPPAVAVELLHNFSLLHDDVMDRDRTRRHRATAWSVFGTSAAILAGDALLALAYDTLGAVPRAGGTAMLGDAVRGLLAGQHADLAFETRADVSLAECVAMAEAKTGALLGHACGLGAWSAGAGPALVAACAGYGRRLGLAFQLTDDLLGIWGDPARTGKAVYADLQARKRSLPVVAALHSGTAAGAALAARYARTGPLTDAELAATAALVAEAGGRDWARTRADELLTECDRILDGLNGDPAATAALRLLTAFTARRDH
ncbi:dimethylallyltransferase [Pilimelia terevasa]|uniref:Dimethylallyltransferase n=1 Tax=Pilimelia terevasa TaxID=53372 RepID=A0A8J3FER2_9ACTN|nr:polyprenyl synthetase family protein [Pilimelia terevasa]GGK15161.1 dimethylallyltransferase [Pilimelia terevasa]